MYQKIKIIGKDVDIKIVDLIEDEENTLGQWVGTKRTIYLKKDQPYINETLFHELFEAIKDDCDLKLNHSTLSTLSVVLYQILKEYPDILNELSKVSEKTKGKRDK